MINYKQAFENPAEHNFRKYRGIWSHPFFKLIVNVNLPYRHQRIRRCLAEAPKLVNLNINGFTPLYVACRASRTIGYEVVKILLESGAKLKRHRYNALYAACRYSNTDSSNDVIELLATHFRINLHAAMYVVTNAKHHSHPSTIDVLIQAGLDINSVDANGNGLLHATLKSNKSSFAMIVYLIENGINIHIRNKRGETALMLAAGYSLKTTLLLLDHNTDVAALDFFNNNALMIAGQMNRTRTVAVLLDKTDIDQTDSDGDTALMKAVRHRWNHTVTKILIENGASMHIRNKSGATALHIACRYSGHDTVLLLLKAGADVNAITLHGNTPLISAISGRDLSIAELLVEHGANINIQNHSGRTALHLICKYVTGTFALDWLILNNLNVNLADINGNTPLFFLAMHQGSNIKLANALVNAGANLKHQDNAGFVVKVGRNHVRLRRSNGWFSRLFHW